MSQAKWLERSNGILPADPEWTTDLSNHHQALIQCLGCEDIFLAFYPPKADPNHLRCTCGSKDSKIIRYMKYIYVQ